MEVFFCLSIHKFSLLINVIIGHYLYGIEDFKWHKTLTSSFVQGENVKKCNIHFIVLIKFYMLLKLNHTLTVIVRATVN